MYSFFSLGWAVTLACIQGLIQKRGVFLRTPKTQGESRTWHALRVTQWETLIGLTFMFFGWAAFFARPDPKTLWLALLLALQASLYLAAPYYSLLSNKAQPVSRLEEPDRGQPVLENKAARWAWAVAAMLAAVAVVGLLLPQPLQPPSYTQFQPIEVPPVRLFGLEQVPVDQRANSPTPEPTLMPEATSTAAPIELPTLAPTLPPVTPSLAPTLPPPTAPPATPIPTQPAPTELPPTQPPPVDVPLTPTTGP